MTAAMVVGVVVGVGGERFRGAAKKFSCGLVVTRACLPQLKLHVHVLTAWIRIRVHDVLRY